jgi:hypothetical protein
MCGRPYLQKKNFQLSLWLLVSLVFCALIIPTAALDNESHMLAHASRSHVDVHWSPIGLCLTILFLVGHHFVALFHISVGPLMGTTSILWLMMRNDAAISPKVSWM